METVKIVKIYDNKVWIESDLFGATHVMVQSEAPSSEPFQYATFFYRYDHTDNASVRAAAMAVAESIGGKFPIEHRCRELEWPNAGLQGRASEAGESHCKPLLGDGGGK